MIVPEFVSLLVTVTVSSPSNWSVPLLTKVVAVMFSPLISRVAPELIVRVLSMPTFFVENETTPEVLVIVKFSKLGQEPLLWAITFWLPVPLNITDV